MTAVSGAEGQGTIRALLLNRAESGTEPAIRGALEGSDERDRIAVVAVGSLAETESLLAADRDDTVIVLPIPGGGEGLQEVVEVLATAPDVPVVVIAEPGHEALAIRAVHLGASDYLLAGNLFGTLVGRCLRHAVEVERMRSRLARRRAEIPAGEPEATGPASLREALPRTFEQAVDEYGQLLDLAVEEVVYDVTRGVDERLRKLAHRLGDLGAGPRDAIEVHNAAVTRRREGAGSQRARALAAEGNIRLVQLMGNLVSYYRRFRFRRGAPADRAPMPGGR